MENQKFDKFIPEEKSDAPQPDKCRSAMQDYINYCVPGIMSRCRAGAVWPDQQKCKYYKKATTRDKCMHYIEALGGHCDCAAAQRESSSRPNRDDDGI